MGKPNSSNLPPYRDDPSYDDAVSLHTTRDEDDTPELIAEETLAEPPPYTDDPSGSRQVEGSGLALNTLVFRHSGEAKTNSDGSFIVWSDDYDTAPEPLFCEIMNWGKIPPAKIIHIKGTHKQTVKNGDKSETKTITDFDVKVRLTEYLFTHPGVNAWRETKPVENIRSTYRGSIFKRRATAPEIEGGELSAHEWCQRYVEDPAKLKVFHFSREVTGLNEGYLRERLDTMVRHTNYRGHLSINFPIENPGVDIYSNNRVNRLRHHWGAIIASVITLTIIFIWPILFFLTKRYAVVRAEWPFSKTDEETGQVVYATISEEQWFNRWAKKLEKTVIGKQQVTLTQEDLARPDEDLAPVSSGNQYIDGAANFLNTGVRVYNQVNRQLGWGYDC